MACSGCARRREKIKQWAEERSAKIRNRVAAKVSKYAQRPETVGSADQVPESVDPIPDQGSAAVTPSDTGEHPDHADALPGGGAGGQPHAHPQQPWQDTVDAYAPYTPQTQGMEGAQALDQGTPTTEEGSGQALASQTRSGDEA